MKAQWSVVVVYENPEVQGVGTAFCDRLVERFWSQFDFDISWWSFEQLEEAHGAREASDKAASANLILFASQSETEIPLHVRAWIESWLWRRGEHEGALAALIERGANGGAARKHCYLRQVAHHAGLDYLTQVPQSLRGPIPDSVDSCIERAREVTGVLKEILEQPALPRELNEMLSFWPEHKLK